MVAELKNKTKQKKIVKKSFFEVTSDITATQIELYAGSKEELVGKTVKIDLTKNLRGKALELVLRIKKENDSLFGEPEKLELAGSYVRKAMRKGADYCEDSFEAECRDFLLKIKPLLITRKRVTRNILKELRNNTKKIIEPYIKTRDLKETFSDVISNKLQKQLVTRLKKIYPLALCEIRVLQVIKPLEESKE